MKALKTASATKARSAVRAPRMDRDARIADILVAARETFLSRGYHAAAVSEIARTLGVAEGTIFKYFPTKRDLLNKVIEHWYGDLFGDYSKELGPIQGAKNRFRYLVWRHLCTVVEWPEMCRLIFTEVRVQPDYAQSPLHEMNHRYTGLLVDVVREGIRSKEFRQAVAPELIRDLVYGGIEHHAWRFLYGNGELDPKRVADQLTDLVCGGVQAEKASTVSLDTRKFAELTATMERAVNTLVRDRKSRK
ncbi:TetR family transcriptional regulator [Panacagrimonas perspica]|uniref:TetR family transcriptional regulator n=1 Tax=Panacagrimonas perspica TaxID=381431 RepID=A0A4R7PAB4_9GAMM|nr:TetR/AcrR family transcriptional regulator [Panacagrimonas perspica]TDU30974.1 TetR family transcriptional regulator [Panacagrimonas perspica]